MFAKNACANATAGLHVPPMGAGTTIPMRCARCTRTHSWTAHPFRLRVRRTNQASGGGVPTEPFHFPSCTDPSFAAAPCRYWNGSLPRPQGDRLTREPER